MSKGLSIKDISGRNFLLSKYPIIELAVVNETGPDLDGCLENLKYQLEEYLVQVAETIIDNQIGWKIIEFIEQNNMVGGKVLKIKNDWIIFIPYCSLKSYLGKIDDSEVLFAHEKIYGVILIDIGLLLQTLLYVLGKGFRIEEWNELQWMIYDVFETCYFEIEDYFPINYEGRGIDLPIWCNGLWESEIKSCFYKKDIQSKEDYNGIGAYMKISVDNIETYKYIFPHHEITDTQKKNIEKENIKIVGCPEDFLEIVQEIIYSIRIISE